MEDWESKRNDEIRHAQILMNEEYEAIKLKIATLVTTINKLTKRLDELDSEYLSSKEVIDKRLKF